MAPDQYARMHYPEKRQFSFLAFEALEFAGDHGRDFAFKTAVYDLMWTEGHDIGEPETLMAAGERVGLDPAEMQIALHERLYAERALAAVNQARDIGITSTPTIFLGKTRINGWNYYEVMQQVMEKQGMRIRARRSRADPAGVRVDSQSAHCRISVRWIVGAAPVGMNIAAAPEPIENRRRLLSSS